MLSAFLARSIARDLGPVHGRLGTCAACMKRPATHWLAVTPAALSNKGVAAYLDCCSPGGCTTMDRSTRPSVWTWRCIATIFTSLLLRFVIFALYSNDLQQRVELSNAFNGFKSIKEASALLRLGLSPYSGSGVRAPPLAILVFQPLVVRGLELWPFILADVACAGLLFFIASHLQPCGRIVAVAGTLKEKSRVTPSVLACIYLCNPLTLLSCCSLSLASISHSFLILAVYGAVVHCSPVVAAVGLAVATYLDVYTLIFYLPLLAVLSSGAEDVTEQPCSDCLQQACKPADAMVKLKPHACESCAMPKKQQILDRKQRAMHCAAWLHTCRFLAVLCLSIAFLMVASDVAVMSWPSGRCLEWLHGRLETSHHILDGSQQNDAIPDTASPVDVLLKGLCWLETMLADYLSRPSRAYEHFSHAPKPASQQWHTSWMSKAYGGLIVYDDLSPNIGVWWYFIGEMFEEFRAMFKFVLHSQILLFSVPITIRFYRRPLFVFYLHAMLLAVFKPYPVAADAALYLTVLPLFAGMLMWAQPGIMMGFIMHMAAVTGPATLYQWLHTGSANANFFYAMTLVWAAAQVLIMVMLAFALTQHEVDLSRKTRMFKLPGGAGKKVIGEDIISSAFDVMQR